MKRLFTVLIMTVLLVGAASASDEYSRNSTVLPTAARTTLQRHFKADVSIIKIDKTLGRVDDYEVVLTDGTEIKFDRNGNWEEIEVARSRKIPSGFVPGAIEEYVKRYHDDANIVGVEKERRGYEITLSNGVDMKFDKNGNFKRYD